MEVRARPFISFSFCSPLPFSYCSVFVFGPTNDFERGGILDHAIIFTRFTLDFLKAQFRKNVSACLIKFKMKINFKNVKMKIN